MHTGLLLLQLFFYNNQRKSFCRGKVWRILLPFFTSFRVSMEHKSYSWQKSSLETDMQLIFDVFIINDIRHLKSWLSLKFLIWYISFYNCSSLISFKKDGHIKNNHLKYNSDFQVVDSFIKENWWMSWCCPWWWCLHNSSVQVVLMAHCAYSAGYCFFHENRSLISRDVLQIRGEFGDQKCVISRRLHPKKR